MGDRILIEAELQRVISDTEVIIRYSFFRVSPDGRKQYIGDRGVEFRNDGAYFSATSRISDKGWPAIKQMNKASRRNAIKRIGYKAYREFAKLNLAINTKLSKEKQIKKKFEKVILNPKEFEQIDQEERELERRRQEEAARAGYPPDMQPAPGIQPISSSSPTMRRTGGPR